MGMTYEELLKRAEGFKEVLWYFLDCHPGLKESDKVRANMNDLLDCLDELPFEN